MDKRRWNTFQLQQFISNNKSQISNLILYVDPSIFAYSIELPVTRLVYLNIKIAHRSYLLRSLQ